AYFYLSSNVFDHLRKLQRPLKLISAGMFIIALGVLLAAFISYGEQLGFELYFAQLPLEVYFYIMYIIGSLMIFFGSRQFIYKPVIRV
ncbi:MAG: hypothetical protein M3Q80_00855, partial [bacterium]|nr:hypothetical protein [bacterium]